MSKSDDSAPAAASASAAAAAGAGAGASAAAAAGAGAGIPVKEEFTTLAKRLDARITRLGVQCAEWTRFAESQCKATHACFYWQQRSGYTPPSDSVKSSAIAMGAYLRNEVHRFACDLHGTLLQYIEDNFAPMKDPDSVPGYEGWSFHDAMDFHSGRVVCWAHELAKQQATHGLPVSDLRWFTGVCEDIATLAKTRFAA